MGDPFFDLGNFSVNHGLTAGRGRGPPRAPTTRPRSGRTRLARLTLMRVVSDFREAMWGVLQQGISTLDVDFVAYAAEHFDRLLAAAATPALRAGAPRRRGRLSRLARRWTRRGIVGHRRRHRPGASVAYHLALAGERDVLLIAEGAADRRLHLPGDGGS